jgi:phage gp29-like protein
MRAADDADHHDYLTLAEEIEERDLHYRSVLGTRKLAVAGLEPVVEAHSDDARDVELADAVRELTAEHAFGELVGDLLDALGKGYSVVELNWRGGARWQPSYVWRDPRFFQWDRDTRSQLRIRDQADLVNGLELPPYKFVLHVPRLKTGLPIRGGLARPAAWAYLYKAFSIKDWAAFLEVYGIPMRLGRYGEGASPDDIRKLMSAVVNLGSDAAAVIHKSMEIEFKDAVGSGRGNGSLFQAAADWWDKQLSKLILGQTATTEGTPGKLGNEQAQSDVRQDLLKADAAQLSATLQRDLVKAYIDLNFGPPPDGRYPRLKLHVPEPEDLTLLTTALKDLVPLGLRVQASDVRDKLGLPDPEDDAELLTPSAAPDPFAGLARQFRHRSALALAQAQPGADTLTGNAALDELAEEALAGWEEQLDPLREALADAIEGATDYDDLARRIEALPGSLDTEELTRTIGRVLFLARAAGDAEDA